MTPQPSTPRAVDATQRRRSRLLRRARSAIRASVVLALGVAAAAGVLRLRSSRNAIAWPMPDDALPQFSVPRSAVRDADIAFWKRRADEDSLSAEDRTQLAALYLARARESGSFDDLERAERTAASSLKLRPNGNCKAAVLLASALMGQHRFQEAYDVAVRTDAREPGIPSYVALRGEVALELGRYDEADSIFALLRREPSVEAQPTLLARLARWEELSGHPDAALRLLALAARVVGHSDDETPWFAYRIADVALRAGKLGIADSSISAGLRVLPNDHRLLSAAARLAWMREQWAVAASYGERSIATVPEPATLALVSDAYRMLGDTTNAAQYADAMRTIVLANPGALHRAWSLFLLDHGREIDEVTRRVTAELRGRRDVYGYDLYAWALHKQHREREAFAAAQHAVSRGVRDAQLYYHLAEISRALGDGAAARNAYAQALAINPSFDPRFASAARQALASPTESPDALNTEALR